MKPDSDLTFAEFDAFFESNNIIKDEDEFYDLKDISSGAELYFKKNKEYAFAKYFKFGIGLPGHFYGGRESCKQVKTLGCLDHTPGQMQTVEMSCKNKACNKCHEKWASIQANEIANRLYGYSILKRNRKIYRGKIRERIPAHLVISAPLKDYSKYYNRQDRKIQRQKLIKLLTKYNLDIDGGAMIDHMYRFTAGLKRAYFSPHHHVLYTGWIDGNITKEIYEKTGYIVKQISTTDNWTDVKQIAKYLLSHSAVYVKDEDKRSAEHGIRYFGSIHNKKFKVESIAKHSIDSITNIRKQFEAIESAQMERGKGIGRIKYNYVVSEKMGLTQFTDYNEITIDGDLEKLYNIRDKIIEYIEPKINIQDETIEIDNPAKPQSVDATEEFVLPSKLFEGIILSVEYIDESMEYTGESVYRIIILDPDDDHLCPICSKIMKQICLVENCNHVKWQSFLSELPDSVIVPINTEDWQYPDWQYEGLPYFTKDFEQKYDPGTYQKPDTMELPFEIESRINRNIAIQEIRAEIKSTQKRSPPIDEILDLIHKRPKEVIITTIDGGRTEISSKPNYAESNRTITKSDHIKQLEKF